VAEEREDKPEDAAAAGRETTVGQPVVEQPQPAPAPSVGSSGTSPAAADRQAADAHDPFTDKPELFVAGAFVGAFVVAKLLKKLTGADD
jgi:hypothetical protein